MCRIFLVYFRGFYKVRKNILIINFNIKIKCNSGILVLFSFYGLIFCYSDFFKDGSKDRIIC